MKEYEKPLDKEGWSGHYNMGLMQSVINTIQTGNVQVWADELINICEEGSTCLEIGCGSGISSLWLSKHNRSVTALDYTDESVELVKTVSEELGIKMNVIQCDATNDLPFRENEFDYIFQAGLLEHFDYQEQISLLQNWSRYGKTMISMVPNASSLPYRIGKQMMEQNGTWQYGLEIPRHSMAEVFSKAGINVDKEYTIGTKWAFGFLPKDHYIRTSYESLMNEGFNLDDFMQGYLLVTIGKCI